MLWTQFHFFFSKNKIISFKAKNLVAFFSYKGYFRKWTLYNFKTLAVNFLNHSKSLYIQFGIQQQQTLKDKKVVQQIEDKNEISNNIVFNELALCGIGQSLEITQSIVK